MNLKKAVMFGLDARIALAIFGALSVISGAALYSAIQEARVVKALVTLKELGKAVDAYYLDVGSTIRRLSSLTSPAWEAYGYYKEGLVRNVDSESGWKGPYLGADYTQTGSLIHQEFGSVHIFLAASNQSWDSFSSSSSFCDEATDSCDLWVAFRKVQDIPLIEAIERKVDGDYTVRSTAASTGDFRFYDNTATWGTAQLKYMPIENHN